MNPLQQQLISDIRTNGPLPFVDYMEYCLYAPGYGYYDSDNAIFGAGGDFVTAPELGKLFAGTLARSIASSACNDELLEIGAGSGKLALDLLQALQQLNSLPSRYRILEKSKTLRQRQQALLNQAGLPLNIEWLDDFPSQPWRGIVIANEVLDALPVESFRMTASGLEQLAVAVNQSNQLEWACLPATPALSEAVRQLQQRLSEQHAPDWPLPYSSEICLELTGFFANLKKNLASGQLLFIDYGYLRHEFYHPQRHMGTLVSHAGHQGHFDVLTNPGNQDITAFVDFSAVMDTAEACGMNVDSFQTQANFLIDAGIEQVMHGALLDGSTQAGMSLAHEMKQLMLPGEMGEKFKVLQLSC